MGKENSFCKVTQRRTKSRNAAPSRLSRVMHSVHDQGSCSILMVCAESRQPIFSESTSRFLDVNAEFSLHSMHAAMEPSHWAPVHCSFRADPKQISTFASQFLLGSLRRRTQTSPGATDEKQIQRRPRAPPLSPPSRCARGPL